VGDERRERRRAYLAEHDVECPACGYNLRGLPDDVCPECGEPAPDPPALPDRDRPDPELAAFLAERDLRCKHCGYNLRGLKTGRCPECGTRYYLAGGRLRLPGERWKRPEDWVADGLTALTWIGLPLAAVQVLRLMVAPPSGLGGILVVLVSAMLAASPLGAGLLFRSAGRAWLGPDPVVAHVRGAVILVAAGSAVGTSIAILAV
jgi:predicted Zn-ribbon and HTH transcriptional regulator